MFDTVVMKANDIYIDSDVLLNMKQDKPFTYLISETGELVTRYIIKDKRLPHIKYNDAYRTLEIQVSIPKLLYGNNVTLILERDIPVFFNKVQLRLYELFGITIPHDEWNITRADICWNFQVGNRVAEYIQMLSKQKLPRKTTKTYNHSETVEFSNKSSRAMFYDKHQQMKNTKEPVELIKLSKGILRLEIKPSDNDMRKFSLTKKAIEILDVSFFEHMTDKVLNQLDYPATVNKFDLSWIMENKKDITRIESLLGFLLLKEMLDEPALKNLYHSSSTYNNRKKLAKKMTIPIGNCLEPLVINQ